MGERVGNTPVTGIDQREGERSSLLSGGQLLLRQISSSSASFRPPPPASPSPAKLLGLSSPGTALSQQGNKIRLPSLPHGLFPLRPHLLLPLFCSVLRRRLALRFKRLGGEAPPLRLRTEQRREKMRAARKETMGEMGAVPGRRKL